MMVRTTSRYFIAATLSLFILSNAEAIRKGQLDNADPEKYGKKVFDVTEREANRGTAFNVKYPRCLVTAGHVLNNNKKVEKLLIQTTSGGSTKKHYVDISKSALIDNWQAKFRELAVLWAKSGPSIDFATPLTDADYAPIELKKDHELSPATAKITEGTNPDGTKGSEIVITKGDKPASAFATTIVGYGPTKTMAGANPRDGFSGNRAYGVSNLDFLILGPKQNPPVDGAFFIDMRPHKEDDVTGCIGDSGGPSLDSAESGAKAIGAINGGKGVNASRLCKDQYSMTVSAFNSAVRDIPNAPKSNWDWVNDQIEQCGKRLVVEKKDGKGMVSGEVIPPQVKDFVDPGLDGVIEASDESLNNWEIVHFGQAVSLSAIPEVGYSFDHWEGTACPCTGSTAADCSVSYNDIGTYTESESSDDSVCSAVFVADGTSPTPIILKPNNSVDLSTVTAEIGGGTSFSTTLTNSGSTPLDLVQYTIEGPFASEVAQVGTTCSSPIASGQTCEMYFAYTPVHPSQPTPHSVTVRIQNGLEVRATVLLNGVLPSIEFDIEEVDFGIVAPGSTSTAQVTIHNSSGTTNAVLSSIHFEGDSALTSFLTRVPGSCDSTNMILAPGASCTVGVTFSPSHTQSIQNGLLVIAQNGHESLALPLSGSAFVPDVVQWNGSTVNFGGIHRGDIALTNVTLFNNSSADISGLSVEVDSNGYSIPGLLEIENTSCGSTLGVGESCDVVLSFEPNQSGALNDAKLLATFTGGQVVMDILGSGVLSTPTPSSTLFAFTPAATFTPSSTPIAVTPIVATPTPLPTPFAFTPAATSTPFVG